ncbi:hypothetical protein RhiirA4_467845 [Rhizophagus irregularis]|uniref:DUF4371 domain-containing protein n=1 Tax=Rhizophagus irregularis TaxID=588596 RepID=A0A2I1GWN7_9GLOM|nr:hypothetical protein RhiirA4_467845 [Rhizophagus irregularis]
MEIMKELGTPHISDGSITYTNEISGREFLIAISKIIEYEIWEELSDATAFGVMIDESTDITTTKHLDIYISYVTKQETRFLCLVPLTVCDAESITQVLKILSKLVAFASDGASVMLGKMRMLQQNFLEYLNFTMIS